MKSLIPLMAIALAACNAPLEEAFPPQEIAVEHDGRVYLVESQYDPFELGYSNRIRAEYGRLEESERNLMYALITENLGEELCDGGSIDVQFGDIWTGFGASRVRYLPVLGEWQVYASCA